MPEKLRDLLGGLAALALGVAGYFMIFGWWPLIPTNIAFLDHADRAMHTLGWMFYRDAPWGIPPGSSPNLGIELSNSIALVDGLPLFAIPLKLLSAWLPRPFQYWGYWWLLCCMLQAVFAYLLALEMGARRSVAVIAAGFAIMTPAFIFRLTLHMALSGHWVLLAALWLYAKRSPPRLYAWPLLCALTASIHAYLLVMVLAIWLAAWVQRVWMRRFTWTGGDCRAGLHRRRDGDRVVDRGLLLYRLGRLLWIRLLPPESAVAVHHLSRLVAALPGPAARRLRL